MKALRLAAILLMFVPVFARAESPDLERARAAAESEDWPLALKYLEAAREAAPRDNDVLYLLGAVHARIPGHEIPALIYLHASVDPRKPAPQVVKKSITDLEVAIAKRPGALLDQALAIAGALPAGDRDRVVPAIVAAAARADRPDIARKAALLSERAPDVVGAAVEVALARLAAGRVSDSAKTFEIAYEMTDHEVWFHVPRAVPAIARTPPPSDPVELQAWREKYAEIERQSEARERAAALESDRLASAALSKMYLGVIESANGFGARGYKHWKDGEGRWAGNYGGTYVGQDPTHLQRWLDGARLYCPITCDVKDGKEPVSTGVDRTGSTSLPKVSWKGVATGAGAVKLDDRDLSDTQSAMERLAQGTDPAGGAIGLADLAGRIADASWFLEKNAP